MRLKDYIEKYHKGNGSEFARKADLSVMNVSRYVRGAVPSAENLQKIMTATKGKVGINDFLQKSA